MTLQSDQIWSICFKWSKVYFPIHQCSSECIQETPPFATLLQTGYGPELEDRRAGSEVKASTDVFRVLLCFGNSLSLECSSGGYARYRSARCTGCAINKLVVLTTQQTTDCSLLPKLCKRIEQKHKGHWVKNLKRSCQVLLPDRPEGYHCVALHFFDSNMIEASYRDGIVLSSVWSLEGQKLLETLTWHCLLFAVIAFWPNSRLNFFG